VVEAQLDEEKTLKEAFTGCDGVISALGDDRKKRPKTHNLPHVWNAMKAAGVTKYIGMGSGPMMMPGEKPGGESHLPRGFRFVLLLGSLVAALGLTLIRVCADGGAMAGAYRTCECRGVEWQLYDATAADGPRRTLCFGFVSSRTCFQSRGGLKVSCPD